MEKVTVKLPIWCDKCDSQVPAKDVGIRRSEVDGAYELSIACHGEVESKRIVLDVIAEDMSE